MTQPEKLRAALELQLEQSDAGNNITIREYLHRLLLTFWDKQDSFSGKRPFGNSGWEFDLYAPLVVAGFVRGKLDEEGYVQDVDDKQANAFVRKMIRAAFYGAEEAGKS